ncbi:hypothetical protein ACIRJM_13670 [Streptomyces sp. NPDC102405]|uniref:hypothetical protein n=1 Tax=Streptomyces sp. NPDC102405 TaxID=3366170 RepID=UPI0038302AD7
MFFIDPESLTKFFKMSQDFAAISSAVLAALLILCLTELQSTSAQLHEWRMKLLDEYAADIRKGFDSYWSGQALTSAERRRVNRQLNRYRHRQNWQVWDGAWRSTYRLAAMGCAVGLATVVRWSALAKPTRGYTSATYIVLMITFASGGLLYGYVARRGMQQAVERHEYAIKWAKALDVPDLKNMEALRDPWLQAEGLEPVGWTMWRPLKLARTVRRNQSNPMR